MPKGKACSSKIDFEILPYLTGAINSSVMMLTVAKVTERTRRGQTASSAHFLGVGLHPASYLALVLS